MTPYEAYLGSKPDVSHFCVFGCDAYVHIPKKDRSKLDPTAQNMSFIEYSSLSTAYRLYDPYRKVVCTSRDVTFDEQVPSFSTDFSSVLGDPADPLPPRLLPNLTGRWPWTLRWMPSMELVN